MGFGQTRYQRRSAHTSQLLGQLFERLRGEGFTMSYTIEDFKREYVKEHFKELSPKEQREALRALPPGKRRELLESWPVEELPAASRKPRRKKK